MKRRAFLRGVGGAAIAAPCLSSLKKAARAQDSSPKRVVIFHTPHGCLTNRWFPKVEDGPLTAAALAGTTLEALTPLIDKLLVPRGLTGINALGRPQQFDPHRQAMGSKLTCAPIDIEGTRYPTSHSLDHEIARQVNPNGDTPLVLSVQKPFDDTAMYLSYSAPVTPYEPIVDPLTVYTQLTGLFADGAATEADYRVALGESSLDIVREDLQRYQAQNMSAADQRRVEEWLQLLRETEPGVVAAAACGANQAALLGITPEALKALSNLASPEEPGIRFNGIGDMMMNLMALALICDANRSLLFFYPGYATFTWDGFEYDTDTDGLNHRTGSAAVGVECVDGVLDMLAAIDVWYAGKFLKFVSLLDSIQEGDVSLLDNTATVWLREFSDGGAFNFNNMPIIIAGSAGGYLKQGVVVRLEDEPIGAGNSEANCVEPGDLADEYMGTDPERGIVPINKLYVTLMNAVGCTAPDGGPVEQFGVFDGISIEAGITDPGELEALKA